MLYADNDSLFNTMNWFKKIFNIDRKVYFCDCGNGEKEMLGLKISNTLYQKAMDYVTERELKNEEFLKKISELQETTINQLNSIVYQDGFCKNCLNTTEC